MSSQKHRTLTAAGRGYFRPFFGSVSTIRIVKETPFYSSFYLAGSDEPGLTVRTEDMQVPFSINVHGKNTRPHEPVSTT